MKLAVILPTYNERENIAVLLDTLRTVLKGVSQYTVSYLVVDDNSPDGTENLVREYQKKHKDVYLLTGKKEGLGKALLRGIAYAVKELHADILLQMDSDLSHDPRAVPQFLQKFDTGADFVVGSRYIPGGSIPANWGIHRKIFSVVGNSFVRFGLGYPQYHDWTGGFRAYTKKYFEILNSEMKQYGGYVFQIAFLHKAVKRGARVAEVPIRFTDRRYGRSKIAPAEYIKNIIVYVFQTRLDSIVHGSFGKFLVVGGTGFMINAVLLVICHDFFKLSAAISNIIGAVVAIFSNYNLNNIWTFREQRISGIRQYAVKLLQFYGTSLFGVLVIQTGTIALGVRLFGDSKYFLYFLGGTALLLIWNYIMYSRIIWKKRV